MLVRLKIIRVLKYHSVVHLQCKCIDKGIRNSMAPELIETAKCSTKVDVYSFGCVVYEIIGERQCYDDMIFKRQFDVVNELI